VGPVSNRPYSRACRASPSAIETDEGRTLTGLITSQDDKEVVLRDVRDQEVKIPLKKITQRTPQKVSLMPDQLLRDLTADLLEYLGSLK
jgi:hypothetical protein